MKLWMLIIIGILLTGCVKEDCEEEACPVDYMEHMEDHMVTSEFGFLVDMIPHHQEAVDTSKITLESTTNAKLAKLMSSIIESQKTEIKMMNGWLMEWYPDEDYTGNYTNMMPELLAYEGAERDNQFLEGMITHHEMAVVMAEEVLELEPREEVAEFANAIIEVQSSEIEQMKAMLE